MAADREGPAGAEASVGSGGAARRGTRRGREAGSYSGDGTPRGPTRQSRCWVGRGGRRVAARRAAEPEVAHEAELRRHGLVQLGRRDGPAGVVEQWRSSRHPSAIRRPQTVRGGLVRGGGASGRTRARPRARTPASAAASTWCRATRPAPRSPPARRGVRAAAAARAPRRSRRRAAAGGRRRVPTRRRSGAAAPAPPSCRPRPRSGPPAPCSAARRGQRAARSRAGGRSRRPRSARCDRLWSRWR